MQILPIVAVGPAKLTISSVESAVSDLQILLHVLGPIRTRGRCTPSLYYVRTLCALLIRPMFLFEETQFIAEVRS